MEGYDVVTHDDEKVGTVAGSGDYLIVEHGLLRKTKHALPRSSRTSTRASSRCDHGGQGDHRRLAEGRRRRRRAGGREYYGLAPKDRGPRATE